jgi:hypothetical protein
MLPEELLKSLLPLMPPVVRENLPVTFALGVTPPFALGVAAPPAVPCGTGLMPEELLKSLLLLKPPVVWGVKPPFAL